MVKVKLTDGTLCDIGNIIQLSNDFDFKNSVTEPLYKYVVSYNGATFITNNGHQNRPYYYARKVR